MADGTAFVLGGSGGLRRGDRGALRTWVGIGIVALVVAVPLRGLYQFTGGTMEEGFMLAFPMRMAKGDVPNVDFLHLYGPGALYVLMGWYRLFGTTLAAERTFGLLQHLAIVFGLFTLARPWGRKAATTVGTLAVFYVLTPIGLTAMAWNGGLALTLWSGAFAVRASALVGSRRAALVAAGVAGGLAGLALTYRPDLVLAVGMVLGWLVWVRRHLWAPVVTGIVIGLVPMAVHLAIAGFEPAWTGMFVDPVVHLRAGRELPRPPSWSHLDGALQAIAETEPPWWRLPHLPASNALYLWFLAMVVGTVAFLGFALFRRRSDRSARTAALLVVALVSVGILPQALQRPDSTHLTWVTCVSWPFAVVVVAEVVRFVRPQARPQRGLALGAAVAVVLTFAFTSLFTFRYYLLHSRVSLGLVPHAFEVSRDDRHFYFGSGRAALASQAVIDDLADLAEPGDRLFVGPQDLRRTWYSDTMFYWMFPEMTPATYFMEMDPGLANARDSRLADDLLSADFAILTSFWDGWREPNTSMDYGSDVPNEIIARNFCQWNSHQQGLVRLYYRCR